MASAEPRKKAAAKEFVVAASFDSRRSAERTLVALGRDFRRLTRKGRASALVVSANPDGSLRVTLSRVQTADNITAALVRVPVAWMIGFLGVFSTFKGGSALVNAARVRAARTGAAEQAVHAVLADIGDRAAVVLIRYEIEDGAPDLTTRADDRAIRVWRGSMADFQARLDPGPDHDWVRAALQRRPGRKSRQAGVAQAG